MTDGPTLMHVAQQLADRGLPVERLILNRHEWVEATFRRFGVEVTLALPAERVSADEIARLYSAASNAEEVE
jgi:hypothetical protein